MERGYESSVRRTEARSESGRVSGLEICPPYPVTVHSVVRPANRHAFGNRTSWQSPGARPGPARCSRPNIGVGAQVNPGHGLASSRARGNSGSASGQSGKYPKRALGCRCFESRNGKLEANFGSFGKFPEASRRKSPLR